jgi:hypothetical protein
MQESGPSVPPTSFLPLWARISFACFMFGVASLSMWTEFLRFNWVGFLCSGLFVLLFVPMQKGESRKAYFSNPRAIVSYTLVIGILAAAFHTLYLFATRRF